jgi:hypothetical protein
MPLDLRPGAVGRFRKVPDAAVRRAAHHAKYGGLPADPGESLDHWATGGRSVAQAGGVGVAQAECVSRGVRRGPLCQQKLGYDIEIRKGNC